ncbi:MAG: hypothetical protein GY757_13645 [bacterium]|nr:hypothetical protein [bacterium]
MEKRLIFVLIVFILMVGCKKEVNQNGGDLPVEKYAKYAGVRSSVYGIKPFPGPEGWEKAIDAMAGYFENSTPCAVWIIGILEEPKTCHLEFPSDGKQYTNISFLDHDKHEAYLDYFDEKGIKVFLQVEPANGDVETLIDLVLNRYMHHPSVIGLGIDVEWYKEFDNPKWGVKVDDATAEKWEKQVKCYKSSYRMFLKHWDRLWMPPNYRGDILFISDSQQLKDQDEMQKEFVDYWAAFFYPNPVGFQVGYEADYQWWQKLTTPPKGIGEPLIQAIPQEVSIFWVDFTLRKVLPTN